MPPILPESRATEAARRRPQGIGGTIAVVYLFGKIPSHSGRSACRLTFPHPFPVVLRKGYC